VTTSDDVPWGGVSAEEQAYWDCQTAVENDRYHMVPARDQAERDAYERTEQLETELAEAEARNHHFHGAYPSDYPPHEYQCDHGCLYETEAERTGRIEREDQMPIPDISEPADLATWRSEHQAEPELDAS
jgi:hypothetical protein